MTPVGMRRGRLRRGLAVIAAAAWAAGCGAASKGDGDRVVLLHGLGRTSLSMLRLEMALEEQGYEVHNIGYPSREHTVEELAERYLAPALAECCADGRRRVHFVTHSLGGIVLRYYLSHHDLPGLGRVVMLSPPNRGSELADWAAEKAPVRELLGPAAAELGTGPESLPNRLGPVDFELGVIVGDRSLNPYFSEMIPGPDDGKVSVERAKVEGMKDFLVVPHTHTYIMMREDVIEQVVHFLEHGRFRRDAAAEREVP